MPTTLKDIAMAAGVSIGTVERALKNRDRINPQVAEHIRQLAKEMDYHPNKIASGLVNRSRKYKIAVIFHVSGNEFWDDVLKGIHRAEKKIKDYGVSLQLYFGKDFDVSIQLSLIDQAIAEGANAIVLVPINSPLIAKRIRQLHKENFPVVLFNSYLNRVPCLSAIHCDSYRTGRMAGMLVDRLSQGCGKVIALLPSSKVLGNNLRKEGIIEYFKAIPPTLTLEKIVELENIPDHDILTIQKELNAYPQVQYIIYCGDLDVFLSCMQRVNRKYTTIFYDLSPQSKKALLNRDIDVIITQSQQEQGYQAVNVVFQYLTSKTVPPKELLIDSQIIFKECID